MPRYKQNLNSGWGEYVLADQSQNAEIAGARWKFMEVVKQVLPRFYE